MACPDCDLPNSQCLGQPYLVWDAGKDFCEWPALTECVTDPGSGIYSFPKKTLKKMQF